MAYIDIIDLNGSTVIPAYAGIESIINWIPDWVYIFDVLSVRIELTSPP